MPKSTIAERLKRLRENSGLTGAEWYEAIGVSQRTYNGWERGVSPVKAGYLKRILEVTGVSPDWLLYGTEEAPGCGRLTFPVYACGGGMTWAVDDEAEPYQRSMPERITGYVVNGDSMEPAARDGQIVLCSPDAGEVRSGDLAYVEMEDGTATFKRVLYKDGLAVLQPVKPTTCRWETMSYDAL